MWPSCGVPAWLVCYPGTGKSRYENNDFLPTASTTHSLLHQARAMSRTQRMPTQCQRQLPFGHNKLVKGISVLIAGTVSISGVMESTATV